MASKNTGYQGFVPYAFRNAETTKPGDVKSQRDNKFRRAGVDVVAYDSGRFSTTTTRMSNTLDRSHFKAERTLQTLQIKDRQPMPPRKFIAQSLYSSNFPNYLQELMKIERPTEEMYRKAFTQCDKDGSGFIDKRELKGILQNSTDNQVSPTTSEVFLAFFDKNRDGKISWFEFVDGLASLRNYMKAQLNTKASRHTGPAWLQTKEVKVCTGYVPRSSTQMDLGVEGDVPSQRECMRGNGMRGTTEDLFSGTSKVTQHIPGYRGYISQVRPLQASKPRESRDGMFVIDTYKSNAPGYTGNPRAKWNNGTGKMHTSKSRTENLIDEMWKSRRSGDKGAIH